MRGDKRNYPIPLITLVVVIVLVVTFINFAWATPKNEAEANAAAKAVAVGSQTVNAGDMVGGDTSVSTGGNKAFAFAHGLGDVDINDCLASTQWGTIIVSAQKVVLNKWCAGEVYDAKGLYKMGGIMRCDIQEIRRHFETDLECVEANTMRVVTVQAPIEHTQERHEEDAERHDYEISQLSAQYEALQQALSETAERDRAGRIAYQRAQQERREKLNQYAEQVEAIRQ